MRDFATVNGYGLGMSFWAYDVRSCVAISGD